MAHFAQIDENNIVTQVLVVPDNAEDRGQDYLANDLGLGGTWVQTSYNGLNEPTLEEGEVCYIKNPVSS